MAMAEQSNPFSFFGDLAAGFDSIANVVESAQDGFAIMISFLLIIVGNSIMRYHIFHVNLSKGILSVLFCTVLVLFIYFLAGYSLYTRFKKLQIYLKDEQVKKNKDAVKDASDRKMFILCLIIIIGLLGFYPLYNLLEIIYKVVSKRRSLQR